LRLKASNTSILKTELSPVISSSAGEALPETQHCAQRSPAVAGSILGTLRKVRNTSASRLLRTMAQARRSLLGASSLQCARLRDHPERYLGQRLRGGLAQTFHQPPYRVAFDLRLLGLAGATGAARSRKGKLHGKRE